MITAEFFLPMLIPLYSMVLSQLYPNNNIIHRHIEDIRQYYQVIHTRNRIPFLPSINGIWSFKTQCFLQVVDSQPLFLPEPFYILSCSDGVNACQYIPPIAAPIPGMVKPVIEPDRFTTGFTGFLALPFFPRIHAFTSRYKTSRKSNSIPSSTFFPFTV